MNGKRALEGSLHTMQAEIDAVLANAKNAEEKSKKAMIDAARLADELRAEQDHTMTQAGAKKALEGSLHTMQAEIDAVLANAKNAEEKSKKAMIDAARLADELRAEQDHTMTQ